jgi:mycoredoxin
MTLPEVTMYSTVWCGHCRRLKRQLDDAGIAYLEIDIDRSGNQHLGDRIEAHTGGYRTVPTLEIGGELYVNPSVAEVLQVVRRAG